MTVHSPLHLLGVTYQMKCMVNQSLLAVRHPYFIRHIKYALFNLLIYICCSVDEGLKHTCEQLSVTRPRMHIKETHLCEQKWNKSFQLEDLHVLRYNEYKFHQFQNTDVILQSLVERRGQGIFKWIYKNHSLKDKIYLHLQHYELSLPKSP